MFCTKKFSLTVLKHWNQLYILLVNSCILFAKKKKKMQPRKCRRNIDLSSWMNIRTGVVRKRRMLLTSVCDLEMQRLCSFKRSFDEFENRCIRAPPVDSKRKAPSQRKDSILYMISLRHLRLSPEYATGRKAQKEWTLHFILFYFISLANDLLFVCSDMSIFYHLHSKCRLCKCKRKRDILYLNNS